jgi:hypothetical protein
MKTPKFKLIPINGGNEYENQKIYFKENIKESNLRMINVFKKMGVNLVNFISLGNSVATGYSIIDTVKPLFKRNESLESQLSDNKIGSRFYNFCRAQKNRDSNVLNWITNDDYTASRINTEIRNSLLWNGDKIDENDYPVNAENDVTFKQVNKDESASNIVVYNGGTGTFLDAGTRNGLGNVIGSFSKDFSSMGAVLDTIYAQNPSTQVYVCGIPQIFPIGLLTKFTINRELKKICKEHPNAVYVTPANTHFLYKNVEGKIEFDFHPNQPEYLNLTNNIISTVADNYIKTAFCLETFHALDKVSDDAQYVDESLRGNANYAINKTLIPIIEKYQTLFEDNTQFLDAMNNLKRLFKSRYPHDFFFIPKKETIDELENVKRAV